MDILIEIINALMEIFIVLFFFKQTLSSKAQKKGIRYTVIITVSIIHILRSFAHIPTYINFSITFLLWSIFLILLFDDYLIRKVIMILIYFVIFIICDMLTRFIVASILNVTYSTSSPTGLERYLGMAISLILNFVMIYSVSLFIKKRQTVLSLKYWIMLLLFPLFSLFIVICTDVFMLLANIHSMKYIVLFLIIVFGLLYFNTVVFEFIDSYSSKLQLEAAEELLSAQEENYRLLEDNETTLRILQHNINKHMEIMNDMVTNNMSEAKEFAQSLQELTAIPLGVVYTNDIVLDAILNLNCKKAATSKIQYTVKVNGITEPLNITAADKSTILCNAIDNAIEACFKVNEKFIVIDIASDKQYVKIQIENSSLPAKIKDNTIQTTKKNMSLHGYGLKSIKQTIKKYNGHLNISYKDGIMTLIILMDNSQKQIRAEI